jgi:hypothetical protein
MGCAEWIFICGPRNMWTTKQSCANAVLDGHGDNVELLLRLAKREILDHFGGNIRLPKRTFVAISHAEAALTGTVFCLLRKGFWADTGSQALSISHQSGAWVSTRRDARHYSQPSNSSGARGSKNSQPT